MLITQLNGQSLLGGTTTAVGGYVGVKELQAQLRRIAFEFSKPDIDPAQYDGKLTLGTIIALANAGPIVGDKIHAGVGQALNVVGLIKAPIAKLPYGETIINFVLSPWIVDKAFSAILGIIRLIPGGGGVATSIDNAMQAMKATVANAAGAIAAVLLAVKKKAGFGADLVYSPIIAKVAFDPALTRQVAMLTPVAKTPTTTSTEVVSRTGYCWIKEYVRASDGQTIPGHWERMRAGQDPATCMAAPDGSSGTPVVRECSAENTSGCPGGVFVSNAATGASVPTRIAPPPPAGSLPTTPGGFPGVVRDHRTWTPGRRIYSTDWSRTSTYSGHAPKANLHPLDRELWEKLKNTGPGAFFNQPDLTVRHGAIAFLVFRSTRDNARMGAFWDERTATLKIIVVPEPSSSKYPWDYATDAVKAAVNAAGDAVVAVGGGIADIATSTWNWIAENADDVYRAVKKYGCALVNNDIVVGLTAAGAGIVATPATSAAIVSGAQAGKAACAAMEVGELLYAIYQLMTLKVSAPPPLTTPEPPTTQQMTIVQATDFRLLLPTTPPVVPLAKPRYPAGSIAAFDVKLHRYRIAIPVGTQLQPLNGFGGLGAAASHFEVETTEFAPPIVSVVPLTAFQKQTDTLPIYKHPVFWLAMGATAAVAVGGGTYALYRRRRRLTT